MGSVMSKVKGCQFRLKYEDVFYSYNPKVETLMYAPYITPNPVVGEIYIRTRKCNAIRKLIRLMELPYSFSLEDLSNGVTYKECYIKATRHIKYFSEPDNPNNKIGIKICFSNTEKLK